jgi:hypothetical protein
MSKKKFTEEDDALLDELGVEVEVKKVAKHTKEEERVIAGFEEIQRFFDEHEKAPQHGEDKDIFERLYAVRLERLNDLTQYHELLMPMDRQGLLDPKKKGGDDSSESVMDDELLDALGVESEVTEIQELKHVRPSKEIRAAEEVANRKKCEDFEQFKELFDQVKEDLKAGTREMVRCKDKANVKIGDLFVLQGQTAYIANAGELFIDEEGREDCRLRVIFNNGTESEMLRRSFQKRLWEDDTARRIIDPSSMGPLFTGEVSEGDKESGTLYVLRSKSNDPYISKHRDLIHKIGFTNGKVEKRIADAANQATYLLADVEVLAKYQLFNVNANKLEGLFHKIFTDAKLDIEIKDRFGKPCKPREWFLVPLSAINKAVECIKDGTITEYYYDTKTAMLKNRDESSRED